MNSLRQVLVQSLVVMTKKAKWTPEQEKRFRSLDPEAQKLAQTELHEAQLDILEQAVRGWMQKEQPNG